VVYAFGVDNIILGMGACLFLLGVISTGTGVVILVTKVLGREVREIAEQTAKLAQKGITDDVSGLVGNASSLVDALNQLVRTAAGVGIFLVLTGIVLIGSSYFLVLKIR
jgi:hypothetical protein